MPLVGLLGATGYTGRLVVTELARRGLACRLGGRDPARLAALPVSGGAQTRQVDTTDPESLAGFLVGLDAVISCVGPFARLGSPVVAAAVDAGVPYVDSTGEPDFIRGVYTDHAGAAVPVVPACGFDYVPGDLAVALAARAAGLPAADPRAGAAPADVLVGYQLSGGRPSRGTARSAAGVLGTVRVAPTAIRLVFPDGTRSAVVVPWGEELTVPRHLPGARVRTALVVPAPLALSAAAAAPLAPLLAPLLRPAARLAGPFVERAVDRLPEGPAETVRSRARFRVLARVRAPATGTTARVLVEGSDPYGLTARFLVEAALRVAAPGAPTGALAPAQAFAADSFLDAVSGPDLRWRVL